MMTKKELVINLMKLDKFYDGKIDELNKALGADVIEGLYPDSKKVKSIKDIIFEYIGIPEDTAEVYVIYIGNSEDAKKGFDEGYCRDFVSDIYYEAIDLSKGDKIIKKATEILISVGENKGYLLPKYSKYLEEEATNEL